MIKAILFDMDGVLFDSFESWFHAFNETLKHFNRAELNRKEFKKKCWGQSIQKNMQSINLNEDSIRYCSLLYPKFIDKVKIFPDTKPTLKFLKNGFKLGLVTNTPKYCVLKILDYFDLKKYFDVVVTGDDVKKGKPDPELINKACKVLNVKPSDTILVGDTENDVKAGTDAGCFIVGLGVNADIRIEKLSELANFMQIKAIIFDADNTLYKVHLENAYEKKFRWLEKKTEIKADKIERKWKEIVGKILNSKDSKNPEKRIRSYSVRKTLIQLGIEAKEAEGLTKDALKIFWDQTTKDLKVFPHTKETVKKLSKKYPLVVASDEFRPNLEVKLNKVFGDWEKCFKFLVTPEITKEMKPCEKYYQIALKKLNLAPSEVLVIGDSWKRDLEPAHKIGIKTVLINRKMEGKPAYWIKDVGKLQTLIF